jgi:hypothetical protein
LNTGKYAEALLFNDRFKSMMLFYGWQGNESLCREQPQKELKNYVKAAETKMI